MKREIYIYNDYGSSEFCVKSLIECFKLIYSESLVDINVRTISAEEILSGLLACSQKNSPDMVMLIMGGGFDLGFEKMLGQRGTSIIREFVKSGGYYLGICAGAYFATDYVQFDLNGPLEVLG
jgi:glutamine amidotransferase-like uncharacterized protein